MTTKPISDTDISKEFEQLIKADVPKDPAHYQVGREKMPLNRYRNVLPNEPTRVTFNRKSKYVNANWMLGGKAIASQGPRDVDLQNFFYMIRKRKVQVVVSLTNPTEKKVEKCFDYWSPFDGEVVFKNEKERIVKREVTIPNHSFIHFHLENWPDRDVVKPETLAALVCKVHEASNDGVFLVHCSAGIGRTGTFFAAYDAAMKESRDIFEIAKAIRHPETGRVGSIQNKNQYLLVHKTVELLV